MKFRKIICILWSVAITLSCCACEGDKASSKDTSEIINGSISDTTDVMPDTENKSEVGTNTTTASDSEAITTTTKTPETSVTPKPEATTTVTKASETTITEQPTDNYVLFNGNAFAGLTYEEAEKLLIEAYGYRYPTKEELEKKACYPYVSQSKYTQAYNSGPSAEESKEHNIVEGIFINSVKHGDEGGYFSTQLSDIEFQYIVLKCCSACNQVLSVEYTFLCDSRWITVYAEDEIYRLFIENADKTTDDIKNTLIETYGNKYSTFTEGYYDCVLTWENTTDGCVEFTYDYATGTRLADGDIDTRILSYKFPSTEDCETHKIFGAN